MVTQIDIFSKIVMEIEAQTKREDMHLIHCEHDEEA